MCSPIKFTRPGARTTCTGPAEEPNACANAAVRSVEVMRLIRSRSFAPAALRMTRALAPGIIEELLLQLPHRPPRGADVRERHLGVLPRQQHAVCASLKRRPYRLVDVVGLGLLFIRAGGNVDVDPRPDLEARPRSRHGALGLAQHVVGREALLSDAVQRLLAVLLHAVGEVEDLLGSEVREQRRMDVANVLREAGTAAVVVHDDLQEVRVLSELAVILLGAVER